MRNVKYKTWSSRNRYFIVCSLPNSRQTVRETMIMFRLVRRNYYNNNGFIYIYIRTRRMRCRSHGWRVPGDGFGSSNVLSDMRIQPRTTYILQLCANNYRRFAESVSRRDMMHIYVVHVRTRKAYIFSRRKCRNAIDVRLYATLGFACGNTLSPLPFPPPLQVFSTFRSANLKRWRLND